MKRFAVVLAVLLAILGGLWWLHDGEDARADPGPVAETRPASTPSSQETPVEVAPETARAVLPRLELERAADPTAGSSKALSDGERTLSGTIVVMDEQGIEHANESGSFELTLWSRNADERIVVPVADGRWSALLSGQNRSEAFDLEHILLGGRRAASVESQTALEDGMALRVRWPRDSRLFVRDRASGLELDHVMVVVSDGTWDSPHPGDAAGGAEDRGKSPIVLTPSDLQLGSGTTVFASNPGHAWGRISIDADRGGDRILPLELGGGMDVQLIGEVEDPNAILRLSSNELESVFELSLGRKRKSAEISGLLPGHYRLTAQITDRVHEPIELGSAPAVIVAGQRTRVSLAMVAPAPSVRVRLAGTLVIPEEWHLDEFSLEFEALETVASTELPYWRIPGRSMSRSTESRSLFHWEAPPVKSGRYQVDFAPIAFSVVLDVREQGLLDARIELPPPATVCVRCQNELTAHDLIDARVSWHFKMPDGAKGLNNSNTAEWDTKRRCFPFRAPIGPISVSAQCEGYDESEEECIIVPGENATIIRLRQLCTFKPILRDGDSVIPIDDIVISLESAEGQEAYEAFGHEVLYRRAPGLYTLKIPPIPGFEPVPDATVRLETGVVVEHVVKLVRQH